MPKRVATTELTHVNWDKDDSGNEEDHLQIGVPTADACDLQGRRIIAAKRRTFTRPPNANEASNGDVSGVIKPNLFSSFTGFLKNAPSQQQEKFGQSKPLPSTPAFNPSKSNFNDQQQIHSENIACAPLKTKSDDADRVIFVDVDKDAAENDGVAKNVMISDGHSTFLKKSASEKIQPTGVARTTDDLAGGSAASLLSESSSQHKTFCKHLKALNEGVLRWIEKHLRANPYIDLTPVFDDYAKHFNGLERRFYCDNADGHKKQNGEMPQLHVSSNQTLLSAESDAALKSGAPKMPTFAPNFDASTSEQQKFSGSLFPGLSKEPTKALNFGFHQKSLTVDHSTPKTDAGSIFSKTNGTPFGFPSFGTEKVREIVTTEKSPGFSFGFNSGPQGGATSLQETPSTGLFACLNRGPDTNVAGNVVSHAQRLSTDEDHYNPPEPETVTIEESDAFHSVKCKLFYKTGEKYVDKGIGLLHLKNLENGRIQLLIRTYTTLGNILLNVCLSESTPCSRNGKNNVNVVCVPNPPLCRSKSSTQNDASPTKQRDEDSSDSSSNDAEQQVGPVVFLIRVGTTDEADQLYEKMTKNLM